MAGPADITRNAEQRTAVVACYNSVSTLTVGS